MDNTTLDLWFLEHKRSFPWRDYPTPYRVWVSEVMLQQTRAQVVVPYFERWMQCFPSIEALAQAPMEQVIKLWEGLGYYRRARNLHAGARQIMQDHGGQLPNDREALLNICGLGSYTVSAILSFGFHQRAAAIDGNVLRVISRYAWIDEDIQKSSGRRRVEEFANAFLSPERPWITAEALIELGATVCTPIPRCSECPLHANCKSYLKGHPTALPIQSASPKLEKIIRGVVIIEALGSVLVRQNPPGQLMGDLWEFPYFENKKSAHALKEACKVWGLQLELIRPMSPQAHSFTRFLAQLFPFHFTSATLHDVPSYTWVPIEALGSLSFSAGHRKIMREIVRMRK